MYNLLHSAMEWIVCVCCPASGRQPRWDRSQTWLWAKTLSDRSRNDIFRIRNVNKTFLWKKMRQIEIRTLLPRARRWGKIKRSTERRQSAWPWARSSRLQTRADQACSRCSCANLSTCHCSFRSQPCYSKHLFRIFLFNLKFLKLNKKQYKNYTRTGCLIDIIAGQSNCDHTISALNIWIH